MRLRSLPQSAWRTLRAHPLAAGLILLAAFAVVQLVLGAIAAGVTTDEPVHVDRLAAFLEDGWYVPGGEPDRGLNTLNPFVYGPAFSLLGHIANVVAGNEVMNDVSDSASAYAVRHVMVAVVSLLTLAAVGFGTWRLTRSPRFGLFAALALFALPRWTGHSFFNLKDVPAGAGYTLVTVGLMIALIGAGEEDRRGWGQRIGIGVLIWGGFLLGAGTRLSLWLPFLISVLVYALLRLGQALLGRLPARRDLDLSVGLGTLAGLLSVAAVYPNASRTPLDMLSESIDASASYPYQGFTLVAGQFTEEHPPWWYLPAWFGGTEPLLLGGLTALGIVAAIALLVKRLRGSPRSARFWGLPELGLLLVGVQMLLLPVGTVVTDAITYGGLRQHLYVLPALAIVSAYGAARLWRWVQPENGGGPGGRPVAIAILALALLIPIAEQTGLYPYNYTYVNPVAGIGGVNDRWETDYWFASAPEAIARVPADAELVCATYLIPGYDPDKEATMGDCVGDQFEPYDDRKGEDADPELAAEKGYTWLISRKRGGNFLPPYCESVDDVTRWLRGEDVTIAFVARCDPRQVPDH